MRILKLFVLIILVILLSIFVDPVRNLILKNLSESLLSTDFFSIEIDDIESTYKTINIKNALLKMKNREVATLDKVKIKYSLRDIWQKKQITVAIDIEDKGTIFGEETSIEAHTHFIASSFRHKSFSTDIMKISSNILSRLGTQDLEGKCNILWRENDLIIDNCYISGNSEFNIMVNGEFDGDSPKSLTLAGNINKLPNDLHKELHKLLPQSQLLDYLDSSFSGSLISNGSWSINLPKEFFNDLKIKPEYISGKFKIDNLDYKYHESYPEIKSIQSDLNIDGSILDFTINAAKTNNTNVTGGNVKIDLNQKDISVIVDIATKGPTLDLIDYIEEGNLQKISKQGINLKSIKGLSIGSVKMAIPLDDREIDFDINVNSQNSGLSIFDDNVRLTKGLLKGSFDNKMLKINGKGLVNGFESNIALTSNMSDSAGLDNELEIKSILTNAKIKQKAPLFSITDGLAHLDILYRNKGDASYFSARSDLTNVGYNISKLGLFKKKGQKAKLEILGKSSNGQTSLPLKISLLGDNIEVEGESTLSSEITQVYFPKIKSNNTKYTAQMNIMKGLLQVDVHGNFIDLSNSSMLGFLSKDTSSTASDIKVKFDNVRLRNDIYLDNFVLDIVCGIDSCSSGILSADLGTKKVLLTLHPHQDFEEWRILVTNAGAFLEGMGIVDNIKAGILNMSIKTNIKEAAKGDIIPIAEGNLIMEKFVTVNNKFLTNLVSNLSLPGLLNTIRNSNDISFSKMSSKFDYAKDVINIYEGKAEGPYMNLTIKGMIDTAKSNVKIKGSVTPSIYGINSIFNRVPILGRIISGKGGDGILSAPYSIEHSY